MHTFPKPALCAPLSPASESCSGPCSASLAGVTASRSHGARLGRQRPHIRPYRTRDLELTPSRVLQCTPPRSAHCCGLAGQRCVVAASLADSVSRGSCDHRADSVLFSVGRRAPCRVSEQDPVTLLVAPSPAVTLLASGARGCHTACRVGDKKTHYPVRWSPARGRQ